MRNPSQSQQMTNIVNSRFYSLHAASPKTYGSQICYFARKDWLQSQWLYLPIQCQSWRWPRPSSISVGAIAQQLGAARKCSRCWLDQCLFDLVPDRSCLHSILIGGQPHLHTRMRSYKLKLQRSSNEYVDLSPLTEACVSSFL